VIAMLVQVWDWLIHLIGLRREGEPKVPPETLRKMDAIPNQLDRIIEKRIRNNIVESAYLERLRREGEAAHER
jgi:hypothetical protein